MTRRIVLSSLLTVVLLLIVATGETLPLQHLISRLTIVML
jgi:hypothetical protein